MTTNRLALAAGFIAGAATASAMYRSLRLQAAANVLMGNATAYRIVVPGVAIVSPGALISDCRSETVQLPTGEPLWLEYDIAARSGGER